MAEILCWHFASNTLRDGSPLPAAGVALPCIANPLPCERGYHGSVRMIHAIHYAPGPYLARVKLHGTIQAHGNPVDKHCASLRTSLTYYVNVSDQLREFTRWSALQALRVQENIAPMFKVAE